MEVNKKTFIPRSNEWGLSSIWNLVIGNKPERGAQERNYIWASELGKAPIETFLKMRGVESSNPPNQRSKRKFVAGNFFERLVGYVLKIAGILKDTQKRVVHQYPGLLEVTGKIDFLAGGIPDYDTWKEKLTEAETYLIQDFMEPMEAMIENFRQKYPEGLADLYLEIKSCSSFMMNSMEKTGRASKNHRLQLFHYLKSENYPKGLVVYICRDDMRMFEVVVMNPSDVENEYREAIEVITGYYNAHKDTPLEKFLVKPDSSDVLKWEYNPAGIEGLPPLEKNIVWDDDLLKFARNWGVEYSNYLTMLYGFETQLEYEEAVMPTVSRWNRVMGRLKTADARKAWLSERGLTEEDVKKEKVEGIKGYVQYVVTGGAPAFGDNIGKGDIQKIILPPEIQKGYEMTDKNVAVLLEIAEAGFKPYELSKQFAGDEEEAEETV